MQPGSAKERFDGISILRNAGFRPLSDMADGEKLTLTLHRPLRFSYRHKTGALRACALRLERIPETVNLKLFDIQTYPEGGSSRGSDPVRDFSYDCADSIVTMSLSQNADQTVTVIVNRDDRDVLDPGI